MILIIFEELDGDKVMLPVDKVAFEEVKTDDGAGTYVKAYYDGQIWALKETLSTIGYKIQETMRPVQAPSFPPNIKSFQPR